MMRVRRMISPFRWRCALGVISILLSACAGTRESDFTPAGRTVSNGSGTYSLTLPNDDWLRVKAETPGESGSDFELHRKESNSWISATRRKEARLDEIVPDRRAALLSNGAKNYAEKRYFLDGPDRITASLARYRVGNRVILVLTAIQSPFAVEIIAATTQAAGVEREIIQILESVRFRGREEAP